MLKELKILNRVLELRNRFKCTKLTGAFTAELIRKELIKEGEVYMPRPNYLRCI